MSNKLYFKDAYTQITDTYAIFGSRRYPITSIQSIQEAMKTRPSPMNNIAWAGVMLLVLGALFLMVTFFSTQLQSGEPTTYIGAQWARHLAMFRPCAQRYTNKVVS